MDQVDVLREMFEQVRKEHNFPQFYSGLKRQNIAYYIYYLATDNIRAITVNDEALLIRGNRELLKVSTIKNPEQVKKAARIHNSGKSTFLEYTTTLVNAGVFRWVTDVNDNKRRYYSVDDTLLYMEDVESNKPLI
ncbi:TPA: DUF1398 family protein [Escherichia coli]